MRFCNLHLHFAKWMHDAVEIFWQELRMKGKLQNTHLKKSMKRRMEFSIDFFLASQAW